MIHDNAETDVQDAFGRLTDSGPGWAFTTTELIAAGRRRRRFHNLAVAGGSLTVVALLVGATLATPSVLVALGKQSGPAAQVASSTAPSPATPSPAGSPSSPPTAHPTCAPATGAQWNTHLVFEARLRALLPPISGTLSSGVHRSDEACSAAAQDWRKASWTVARSNRIGSVSGSVSTVPASYRHWLAGSPCTGAPQNTCTLSRRGGALVEVTRTRTNGSPQASESIEVTAVWPDDTNVSVSAATSAQHEQMSPLLASVPLTEQQLLDLALNPQLRA